VAGAGRTDPVQTEITINNDKTERMKSNG